MTFILILLSDSENKTEEIELEIPDFYFEWRNHTSK